MGVQYAFSFFSHVKWYSLLRMFSCADDSQFCDQASAVFLLSSKRFVVMVFLYGKIRTGLVEEFSMAIPVEETYVEAGMKETATAKVKVLNILIHLIKTRQGLQKRNGY